MLPSLIFSDKNGRIYAHPYLKMAVSSLHKFSLPQRRELIKIPQGSRFFYLPHRFPVGYDPQNKQFQVLDEFRGKKVFAVGAFLIPAYLRLYNPATCLEKKRLLPLWAYTAAGFYGKDAYATARRVDFRLRQSPRFYNQRLIRKSVEEAAKEYSSNRLFKHLANCALNYNCLAAKNLFLKRWEAPLPVSRYCNASCIGCLSHQEAGCTPSHKRINFKPTAEEVAEIAAVHLKEAREPIVSFGQGCEGEPLLEAELIARSIRRVRKKVSRGTINMNTNAGLPGKIKLLCKAGIDSFRISLNSTQEKFYNLYFRPRNYKFSDLFKSIAIAKKHKKFVSLNLFVFPGFSDSEEEISSLVRFVRKTGITMIQWRNLNIDPDFYLENMPHRKLRPKGIEALLETIRKEFPGLKSGYFNLPKEKFNHS